MEVVVSKSRGRAPATHSATTSTNAGKFTRTTTADSGPPASESTIGESLMPSRKSHTWSFFRETGWDVAISESYRVYVAITGCTWLLWMYVATFHVVSCRPRNNHVDPVLVISTCPCRPPNYYDRGGSRIFIRWGAKDCVRAAHITTAKREVPTEA